MWYYWQLWAAAGPKLWWLLWLQWKCATDATIATSLRQFRPHALCWDSAATSAASATASAQITGANCTTTSCMLWIFIYATDGISTKDGEEAAGNNSGELPGAFGCNATVGTTSAVAISAGEGSFAKKGGTFANAHGEGPST